MPYLIRRWCTTSLNVICSILNNKIFKVLIIHEHGSHYGLVAIYSFRKILTPGSHLNPLPSPKKIPTDPVAPELMLFKTVGIWVTLYEGQIITLTSGSKIIICVCRWLSIPIFISKTSKFWDVSGCWISSNISKLSGNFSMLSGN